MRVRGRVAIITGVSGDGQIGQAVAQAFAKEGVRLVPVARRVDRQLRQGRRTADR